MINSTLSKEALDFLNQCTRGTWKLNSDGRVDVIGSFSCRSMALSSFYGVKFGLVTESFDCSFNNLTSLDGAPTEIIGAFYCNNNELTNLVGGPQNVHIDYHCQEN